MALQAQLAKWTGFDTAAYVSGLVTLCVTPSILDDTVTILIMTLLITTLLKSEHSSASSATIKLSSFYFLLKVKSFMCKFSYK